VVVSSLREVLEEVLPCYTLNTRVDCGERGTGGKIDAIFIEGHTDSTQFAQGASGRFRDNWELSAGRARAVFGVLVPRESSLAALLNPERQPLFSVSGYAETRPVDPNDLSLNRRIDLRFVMVPPSAAPAPVVADVQRGLAGNGR
jgi:hypothetical protein